MPTTRNYIERMTRRDEGRRVEDPDGDVWIVRGLAQKTKVGRRKWYVGLQHAENSRQYVEHELDRITNRSWAWVDERVGNDRSSVGAQGRKSDETPERDDQGRRLCRRCGAPIQFIRMQGSGKPMPVDHGGVSAREAYEERENDGSPTGLVTRAGELLSPHDLKRAADDDLTVYRSHFVTCPGA